MKKNNTILLLLTKDYRDWLPKAIEDEAKKKEVSKNSLMLDAIADKVKKKKER